MLMADRDGATGLVVEGVRRWLNAGYVSPTAPLVVACSGGADSMALAIALRSLAGDRVIAAAIVDHQLQAGSDAVANIAANSLQGLGYDDAVILPVTVEGDDGMEANARRARYRALADYALTFGDDTAVLLGHTCDDQAETVLLGLARGSGPRSIAGMSPWRAPWGRPLLDVRRDETEDLCAMTGVTFWQDPQNDDRAFTRVRIRQEILPLMEDALGGGVAPALARTADLMTDDLAALDELTDQVLITAGTGSGELVCVVLADWPSAIRRRVIRRWLAEQARVTSLTYFHLARLEDLVISGRNGAAVRVPGTIDVTKRAGVLECHDRKK